MPWAHNSRSKSRHRHCRSKRTLKYHMIIMEGPHLVFWNRSRCSWVMVGQVSRMPAKTIRASAKPIPAYQHTCLLLLLGERAPVLSWKKSGQANQYLLCPSQGTKQWCNLRFNIYFLGEHLGSAGLQRELIHANPTRSGRFCIFWLAQVTTPCNFSRSSTFKVPLQLQDPLKKINLLSKMHLDIKDCQLSMSLDSICNSWNPLEDEMRMW